MVQAPRVFLVEDNTDDEAPKESVMPKQIRALIVEDCEDDALLLTRELRRQGFDLQWDRVYAAEPMQHALQAQAWDVVLSDHHMPGFSALQALALTREHAPDIPFIIISGTEGEDTAAQALRAGAQDYLMRGQLARLGQAIRRELRESELHGEHRRGLEQVRHLNRVLRALRDINKLIVQERDPGRLISAVCERLVEARGYSSAWIVLQDGAPGVPLVGCSGDQEHLGGLMERIRAGALPACARAALAGSGVVISTRSTPRCEGCVMRHRLGEYATLAAPLSHHGRVLGVLCAAAQEQNPIEGEEAALFQEIVADLAHALCGLEAGTRARESEQKFRQVFQGVTEGILLADSETKTFVLANQAACDLLGYSEEELLRMGVEEIHPPEDLPAVIDAFERQLRGELRVAPEMPVRKRDGSVVYVDISSKPVEIDGRKMLLGCFRDVTDRCNASAQVRRSEQRFRSIFEGTSDLVVIVDRQAHPVFANAAWRRAFGGQLRRQPPVWTSVRPRHQEEVRAAWERLVERGEAFQGLEYQAKPVGGGWATIISNAFPLTLEGDPQYCVTSRDITERKHLQLHLAQTDRLSSLGMLAAGVAHEINNPLSYVLFNLEGLAELLLQLRGNGASVSQGMAATTAHHARGRRAAMDELLSQQETEGRLEAALDGARRIRDIVRGLGAFSRVEPNEQAPVDLRQVIEAALTLCFNEIKYRARVVKELSVTPPVMGSEGRLSQVFLNLLVNAAHAIDEGDVANNEIRISTWTEDDAVLARVQDSGAGISPDKLKRVFEPFFTTKPVGMGSGLGLPISKEIIESYGGTISVQSEAGAGAAFTIRLPATAAVEAPFAAAPEAAPAAVHGRILVVDDEEPLRTVMRSILHEHEVVEAADGDEAREILRADQGFDVILCDMMMGHVSGLDLHKWLAGEYPELARRLIFVSGGAFTPRTRAYLASVENLFLEKPFESANIRHIVERMVAGSRRD